MQEQTLALRRAQRQALGLLIAVALVFAATSFMAPSLWVRCVQAVAEAAMVGALADWFAVTALFRRIPLPWVGRHTAIIPRNKDRIGDNLAHFVRDRFLDPASLLALIRKHDPAQWLASWLTAPAHSAMLGRQVARLALAALELVQDRQVQRMLRDMSTTAQINDSLKLGSALLGEIGGFAKLHKPRVEQAGFAVLKAPDIPSVLVETAFISNPGEEAKLRSAAYQNQLADALMRGIRGYFAKNPPLARNRTV